jgi:predicted transcriptional regulator
MILNAIFERKASEIFKSVASTHMNTDILITQLKLSRKQYYSRMSRLIEAGIVKRENGRYLLTEFGKVVYSAYTNLESKIENAVNNYWKLRAVDSLAVSSGQERTEIVSALIDNDEIKSILIKEPIIRAQAVIKSTSACIRQDTLSSVVSI